MTEETLMPSTPPATLEPPRPCSICGQLTDALICGSCLKFAGPQSIMYQRDWVSWSPDERTMKHHPQLMEIESQFQIPAPTLSPRSPSDALKRRLNSLTSMKVNGDEEEGQSLRVLILLILVLIFFYIVSTLLGVDPLHVFTRLIEGD